MVKVLIGAAALALAVSPLEGRSASAQGRPASSSIELARAAQSLQPGEWVWAPQIAPSGPLLVYVDLSDQIATIYRNGVRIGVSTVSSGKPGHETPTGVFTILQKDAHHRSTKYNNAPMFFMERLTWDGVALHAGGLPGYPESHGCVHLPIEFARLLFEVTDFSVTVVVAGDAARHVGAPPAGVEAPFDPAGRPVESTALDADWRWTPELSPSGPVTVVISKSDRQALVLRNGVEIGRGRVTVADGDDAVHVLTLAHDDAGARRWIYAGLPGHADQAGQSVAAADMGRLGGPPAFLDAIQAILHPGDTVVVTPAALSNATTGAQLTVLSTAHAPARTLP